MRRTRRNRKNTRRNRNRKNNMMGGTSVPMSSCPPGTQWDNSMKRCLADTIACEEVGGTYKNNTKECQPPFTKLNTANIQGGKRRRRRSTTRRNRH